MEPEGLLPQSQMPPAVLFKYQSRSETFCLNGLYNNKIRFYGEGFLASRPKPKAG
jgi:hypothetical protein